MKASEMVVDGLRRVDDAIKLGTFERHELETIIKICDKLKEKTQRALDSKPIQ